MSIVRFYWFCSLFVYCPFLMDRFKECMRFQFLKENQKKYNIKKACKILKVSRSGYYNYLNRRNNRAIENEALTEIIEENFQKHKGRYGARRIQLVLERQGIKVNHKRVSKLMSAHGLIAKGTRKTYRKASKGSIYEENILNRMFAANARNKVWVGDITLDLVETVRKTFPIQAVTADAAYDFPLAHRVLHDRNIRFFVRPQKKFDCSTVEFTRERFTFDETKNAYICPRGKLLSLTTLTRTASGLSWQYVADKRECAVCPVREKCLSRSDKRGARKVERSYFTPARQENLYSLNTLAYRDALRLRQIWCEGSFSAQKRSHNLTQIVRRGREAGGPLPLVGHRFEPEADDKVHGMTPAGVFFAAFITTGEIA